MDNTVIKITIGSHFFKLTKISARVKDIVLNFARSYIKYGITATRRNEYEKVALAVYACATRDKEEFRFHKNQLNEFLTYLKKDFVLDSMIEFEYLDIPFSDKAEFKIFSSWTPREEQIPIIDYIVSDLQYRSRFIGLQTGKGKSLISCIGIEKLQLKTALIVRPMYIYKWVLDLKRYFDIPSERIMVIQGTQALQAALLMSSSGQLSEIDIFIISNKTLQLYFKQYEIFKEKLLDIGYECIPEKLFETLRVGIRLIDEVHQDFHLNFKIDLYTNVFRSISLSATLISKDPFMEKVYNIAYPLEERYKVPELDKYIDSFSIHYRFREIEKIRSSERGSTSYSHNAFELSLIKHKDKLYLQNYLKLIKFVAQCSYLYDRKPGEKLIIFCYRTDFCQIVVDYLKKELPSLDIRRYVSDDPDENMYDPDIRVTTLGSGSTAHDISKLKAAILTVAVDSIQSNIQALGRLRKQDEFTPRFYYFVCDDIKKHRHYDETKVKLLKERAKSFKSFHAPFII